MKITSELIVFEVQDSVITVDISGVKIPKHLFSIAKKFSAICLASRDKFKCTSGTQKQISQSKYKAKIKFNERIFR